MGDIINTLKESAQKTYNYLTGEEVPITAIDPKTNQTNEKAEQKLRSRYQQAYDLAEQIGQKFGNDGLTFTQGDVRALAGTGWADLNELYGGKTGLDRHKDNPQLVDDILAAYKKKQADVRQKAIEDAKKEAEKDVILKYGSANTGDERSYTISKANADDIKRLAAISANEKAPANLRQQATAQLITALGAAGYNLPEGIDATTLTNSDALLNAVAEGEGGLNRYLDLVNILQEAERDRTPKEPEKKTWEQLWQERMEKQYALDRDREQRRIQGERLGRGIGDLAATIGDMIRASEGAPVAQRDWQRIYDNLTAQEKANINNYQVRMQKLQDDIRAEKARQDAIKVAAAQKAADQQFQFNLELQKEKAAAGKQADSDKAAKERAEIAANARIRAAEIRAGEKDGSGKPTRIAINGTTYDVMSGQSFTEMMNSILEVINNPANTAKGKDFKRVTFKPSELQTDSQGFYNRRITELLGPSNMANYTPEARDTIIAIAKAFEFGSESGKSYYTGNVR